jgi:CubicO group peptidase (beta-lactamase class C family)
MTHPWTEQLEQFRQKNQIAGFTVAATDRTHTLFVEGFGVESVERPAQAPTEDTMYRIASITKVVTGLTILRLAQRGVLELHRPVRDYLPWLTLSDPLATERMTLYHLLTHTAGLPAEYTPEGPREESALEDSLREGLPALHLHGLPGEAAFLYSNWGIRLASRVAEVACGKPFSKIARELILDPLGMQHTTFDLCVAATYPISLPHEHNEKGEPAVRHLMLENAARLAAGGLYSTAPDLCILARFLMNDGKADSGEQLLDPAYIAMMRERVSERGPEPKGGYGLTMHQFESNDSMVFGHFGSAPPYSSGLFTEPERGLAVIYLVNTPYEGSRTIIPDAVFAELFKN